MVSFSAGQEAARRLLEGPQRYTCLAGGTRSGKTLLFDVQLPTDNVFGLIIDQVPELLLSPSADSGIYLFLHPLRPGKHALHWKASQTCPSGDSTQDVTYGLTVRPHDDNDSSAFGKAAPIGHGRHIP
jgi:hypothetical protein